MLRALPMSAALVACAPSPPETAMRPTDPVSGTTAPGSPAQAMPPAQAMQGPIPVPVSAAGNPAPARPDDVPATPPPDLPARAQGRRTLSTAFVRIGPDGQLTVERRDGRVLVLRDVVMRPKDYCGVQVVGPAAGQVVGPAAGQVVGPVAGVRYCGRYDEVLAARPGGMPAPDQPDLAPSAPRRSPSDPR